MTYDEFIAIVESRFDIKVELSKSKASHEMINIYLEGEFLCSGSLSGPGMGYHGGYGKYKSIAIFGWSYCLDEYGEWFLQQDGISACRQGSNPFPEIPEEK